MSKKISLSTDLFKGKNNVPAFIKDHPLFRNPTKVQKVFPSIGLPNFREKANIDKCLFDVKKEGTYVHNLLRVMVDMVVAAKDAVSGLADKIQYLETKETREKDREKLVDLYKVSKILTDLSMCVDPFNKDVLESAIQTSEGKIELRLMKDISDENGKIIYRKDVSLFRLFGKVRERCASVGIVFANLEQADAFKIFSKENIPNKEFAAIFSSDGEDGAWDIATMSMRGDWSSCQRWEGEYPRCLVGSVLSKFVGIIYLTSGAMNNGNEKNGNRANLGTKMMRRCVVRYAIDADEGKPCILLDKMYPEIDKDILAVFVNAIKSRTELPVYYSQDLGNKLRHIYLPPEKIRDGISDRDWSYQDTPLKTKHDMNAFILTFNKDEVERELRGFKINLALFVARKMEAIYSGNVSISDPEVKKTISNIRMNTSFTPFCESAATHILAAFRAPSSKDYANSKSYYRKYLMEFLARRKITLTGSTPNLTALLSQFTSRTVDAEAFIRYIFALVAEFSKAEATKLIN